MSEILYSISFNKTKHNLVSATKHLMQTGCQYLSGDKNLRFVINKNPDKKVYRMQRHEVDREKGITRWYLVHNDVIRGNMKTLPIPDDIQHKKMLENYIRQTKDFENNSCLLKNSFTC